HARFHMHYTPTSSSWMNLVERFFRDLTEFISEKSFASTRELADAIIAFRAARNDNPRRYVWKAKGEDILRKIDAARQALAALQPLFFFKQKTAYEISVADGAALPATPLKSMVAKSRASRSLISRVN